MFSGIVEGKELPLKIIKKKQSIILTFAIPNQWEIKTGDSIAIDGICATVQALDKNTFTVYFMDETLKKTSLLKLSDNHFYNLERPLTLNSLIGGHLVSGHIDTTAKVQNIKQVEESQVVTFKIDPLFTKYIIYKGSICVNGVSLTIVSVTNTEFTVSLIPYTLEHTNLGNLKVGDTVNIEVDLLAKYIEKLTTSVK